MGIVHMFYTPLCVYQLLNPFINNHIVTPVNMRIKGIIE